MHDAHSHNRIGKMECKDHEAVTKSLNYLQPVIKSLSNLKVLNLRWKVMACTPELFTPCSMAELRSVCG